MAIPKLPNDIIFRIIKESDGGLTEHKKKMSETLKNISLGPECECRTYERGGGYYSIPLHEWGSLHDGDGIYGETSIHDDDFYYELERQERFKSLWPKEALNWCYSTNLHYWTDVGKERLRSEDDIPDEDIDRLFRVVAREEEPKQQVRVVAKVEPAPPAERFGIDIWSLGC